MQMKERFEQRLFRIFAQAGYSPVQLLTVTPEEMVEIPGITVPNIRAVLCVQNKVLADRNKIRSGKLVEDEYAQKNLAGATEAGLPIGAYFFSQALNMDEADQEIEYMLNILGDYRLDMPIILDWEIPASDARTANMDARTLTDIQLYFCEKMKALGYQPMVYFNWHQSENLYYLSELEDFPFWLALYQDRMRYPWKVEMWQYTCTGRVPGINGDVDINVYMP